VLRFVNRYFPAPPDFLAPNLEAFWQARIRLGIGGALGLLWASQGVFGAISTAVNHAWAVEQPRSFWRHRWFSLLMMATATLLLFITLLALSASKASGTPWSTLLFAQMPAIQALAGWGNRITTFLLFVLIVGLIFYFVPNTAVRLRDVWPGAVVTALLWRGAFEGFSWYVRSWARASVHGSIATVVWFLIWIYISAVILLYGVEFTAAIARIRRERRQPSIPLHAS
jgi:membrane protein